MIIINTNAINCCTLGAQFLRPVVSLSSIKSDSHLILHFSQIVATAYCARVHMIKGTAMFGPQTREWWGRVQTRPSYKVIHLRMDRFESQISTSELKPLDIHKSMMELEQETS